MLLDYLNWNKFQWSPYLKKYVSSAGLDSPFINNHNTIITQKNLNFFNVKKCPISFHISPTVSWICVKKKKKKCLTENPNKAYTLWLVNRSFDSLDISFFSPDFLVVEEENRSGLNFVDCTSVFFYPFYFLYLVIISRGWSNSVSTSLVRILCRWCHMFTCTRSHKMSDCPSFMMILG